MGRVPPPFWQNMQLQNEFPNSCFARILDWERGITLNQLEHAAALATWANHMQAGEPQLYMSDLACRLCIVLT